MSDLPALDLPTYAPLASPMRARDVRPRLTVAAPACLVAEVEHAAKRASLSTMEWCRQSWQATLDGYPDNLPVDSQRWIERQARTMGVSWSEAHRALIAEVVRRYPRGVRL